MKNFWRPWNRKTAKFILHNGIWNVLEPKKLWNVLIQDDAWSSEVFINEKIERGNHEKLDQMKQSHIKSYKSLLFPLMLDYGFCAFFLFIYLFVRNNEVEEKKYPKRTE